jgi:RNA polymerase sigma-70 factor (ECF subfamily)
MMGAESDAEIIRKTLAGNRHAFEALILRYNRMAYAVAFARLGSHQDAEDAVQEGWLMAFSTLDRLREPNRFPAWLASIVRNVSINATRNQWRRRSLEEAGDTLMVDFRESMENADLHRALWAQVATMSPEYREVLTLHYHAGLSTEEIAEWAGLSRESVKKRLQRARSALSEQTLQTLLEPAEREEEKRRKRVMALLLLLPVDWKSIPAAPGETVPAIRRPELTPVAAAGKLQWFHVLLAVALGVALLAIAGFWLKPPPPAPSLAPVQVSPPVELPPVDLGLGEVKGGLPPAAAPESVKGGKSK